MAKTPQTSVLLSKKRGMALAMTIILVPILMGLGASFVDPITRSYRAAASDQKTILAKNMAENLYEEALEDTRDLGVGDDANGEVSVAHDYGSGTGKWWVFGSPELDDEHTIEEAGRRWYTIPAAGSGNAGGDYCSTSDPVVSNDEGELEDKLEELGINDPSPAVPNVSLDNDPFEWPCHWNKLYEGQTVSIPLYVDEYGNIQNPVDLGLNEFELRIRAACEPDENRTDIYDNEICDSTRRYVLDGDTKTTMVLWEIVGDEINIDGTITGNSIVLTPFKQLPFVDSYIRIDNIQSYTTNSLSATDKTSVSTADGECTQWSINQHLNQNYGLCTRLDINKPILNFTLIHTINSDSGHIPYLEYQFRTPVQTGKPSISSNEKLVRTEVMLDGGYSETIEKSIDLTKPVTGFVIQQ